MARAIVNKLSEDAEQTRVVVYLTKRNIPHYASANGGSRNLMEAVKLKRMGVSAGVPDICIPVARKGYHGLYIEMKRQKGGVVSDFQRYWIDLLRREGHKVEVCRGFDEAAKVIDDYFMDGGYYADIASRDEIETEIPDFV